MLPLLEMCLEKVCRDVVSYSPESLGSLPSQLAEQLVKRVLARQRPPPLLHELLILCQAFWRPSSLSLHNRPVPISSHSLLYLCYVPSLTKLDISGNAWLDSLAFLPELPQLQCLNLRHCWRLLEQSLVYIGGLRKLKCLDVQDVYSLTDASASSFLPGLRSLRSLNLSGTGISDCLLETLTYGQRLGSWMSTNHLGSYAGANGNSTGSSDHERNLQSTALMQQWSPSEIVHLSLQRTKITEASLPYLSSFEQLLFLDVRNTEVSGRSLKSIQAKHRLVSLPNNGKILARWNSLIMAASQGSCGCSSMGAGRPIVQETYKEQPCWTTEYEQDGIMQLLDAATRLRICTSSQRCD